MNVRPNMQESVVPFSTQKYLKVIFRRVSFTLKTKRYLIIHPKLVGKKLYRRGRRVIISKYVFGL